MHSPSRTEYTSAIIRAGACLDETRLMLTLWDLSQNAKQNLDRFQQGDLFGKASRSWVKQFLMVLHRRYFTDPETTRALVALAQGDFPLLDLDRILFFHAAQSDRLLHDTVSQYLWDLRALGQKQVDTPSMTETLRRWVKQGKTATPWNETTLKRTAVGLLATLRDFGLLEGTVHKRIVTPFLPLASFSYIAFFLHRQGAAGKELCSHPAWRLFFLVPGLVERFLLEVHQQRYLQYYVAGNTVRLEFPTRSLEEYAHLILDRTFS